MQLSIPVIYILTIITLIGLHIGLWGIFKKAGKSPG